MCDPQKKHQIVPLTLTHSLTHSRLEEKRLHPDKGEVVVPWQTLVADAGEFIPKEWRESVLCCWPVQRLRTKVLSHVEICYLDKGQHRS